MDQIDTVRQPHFTGLTFVEGQCQLEHGAIAAARVAVDQNGQIFLLDNPSGFAYMVRLHPPSGIDSVAAVEYAYSALRMTGKLSARDTLLASMSSIPDSLLKRLELDRPQLPSKSRVLQLLNDGFRVAVVTLGPAGLRMHEVVVYSSSGEVRELDTRDWPFRS
jgi:hypothetical protein